MEPADRLLELFAMTPFAVGSVELPDSDPPPNQQGDNQ
jgi:hypothetical protein